MCTFFAGPRSFSVRGSCSRNYISTCRTVYKACCEHTFVAISAHLAEYTSGSHLARIHHSYQDVCTDFIQSDNDGGRCIELQAADTNRNVQVYIMTGFSLGL